MGPTDESESRKGPSSEGIPENQVGPSFQDWVEVVRSQAESDTHVPGDQADVGTRARYWQSIRILAFATVVLWAGVVSCFCYEEFYRPRLAPRTVRGSVVDCMGNPKKDAIVFVASRPASRITTGPDGSFELVDFPAGPQTLVVAVGKVGQEFPVTPEASGGTDLKVLRYLAPPDL
jgi:hypothetical protein